MECLYCQKRLGLFASRKRPFCSELHEVAYQDEQSGLAMRRVMDPLFTAPVKPQALRLTPEPQPSPAEEASGTVPPRPAPDPSQCGLLNQGFPVPLPPDLCAVGALLDVEPFAAGRVEIPPSGGWAQALESELAPGEITPEPAEGDVEVAEAGEGIVSSGLHPRLEQPPPTAAADARTEHPASDGDPADLDFASSAAYGELRINQDVTPLAATKVLSELESFAAPVPMPAGGAGEIAFEPRSAGADFANKRVVAIAVERDQLIASLGLHGRVQQSKPNAAGPLEPAPFWIATGTIEAGTARAGMKVDLAPMSGLSAAALVRVDPGLGLNGRSAVAGQGEEALESGGLEPCLDPQRLPVRYPVASLSIAGEVFEGPADFAASPWVAPGPARAESASHVEIAASPENPRLPSPAREARISLRQPVPSAPEARTHWELPVIAAGPRGADAGGLQRGAQAAEWTPAPPGLPSTAPALIRANDGFRIPFSGTAAARMTLSAPVSQGLRNVLAGAAEFRGASARPPASTAISENAFRIPFSGTIAARTTFSEPVSQGLRKVLADATEFRGASARPPAPAHTAIPENAIRIPFGGAAVATMTPVAPVSPGLLEIRANAAELRPTSARPPAPSASSANAFRIPFSGAAAAPMTRPAATLPAYRGIGAQTAELRQAPARPTMPSTSSANIFLIAFAGTSNVSRMSPLAPAFPATAPEPIPSGLTCEVSVRGGAPRDRALSQARGSLPPRGIRLGVNYPQAEPLDLVRAPAHSSMPATRTYLVAPSPLGTREFSSDPGFLGPFAGANLPGDLRQMGRPVQTPDMPARVEGLTLPTIRARLAPADRVQRLATAHAFSVTDLQRFRAAAHIRIRESGLRNSIPGDLPFPSTGLPWRGVRMVSELREGASVVPLRPSLQAPEV